MKKKFGALALVLALLMCFFSISAFAEGDNSSSQMPFVETDDISPEYPDIQTEGDLFEQFEDVFGEDSGAFIVAIIIGTIFSSLFIPALIVAIVFAVFNSNTKKKLKEYERFFGPISKNQPANYNLNTFNAPYGAQPVNSTDTPMGNAPVGNIYTPQNDINNQQGGQF